MNKENALAILGITSEFNQSTLKKRYRKLMQLLHPDNLKNGDSKYPYSAQDVNAAYFYLRKNIIDAGSLTSSKKQRTNNSNWNAPINHNALFKRTIFDEVRGIDDNVIGYIEIANDKYLWITDEDFHLFLKSLYTLSKSLLDDIDTRMGRVASESFSVYQAELAYLLSGQFVNSSDNLFRLGYDIEDSSDYSIFYIPAMLEATINTKIASTNLYPSGIRNHRLYVQDDNGKNLGYISFKDDRLSFVVTPLLSQNNIQVKLQLKQKKLSSTNMLGRQSFDVDFWIKLNKKQVPTHIESQNIKIADLLNKYEKQA